MYIRKIVLQRKECVYNIYSTYDYYDMTNSMKLTKN